MKKVIALVIVLGLPLVVTPAGAAKGLGHMSCIDIETFAAASLKNWTQTLSLFDRVKRGSLGHQRLTEGVEYHRKHLIQWATIYQAFCKP